MNVNTEEINKWQNILKARLYYPKSISELNTMVQEQPFSYWYVIVPFALRQQMASNYATSENLKRIIYAPFKDYNFRVLDESKVVSDPN